MRIPSVWTVCIVLSIGAVSAGEKRLVPSVGGTSEPLAPAVAKPDPVLEQLIKDLGADDYRVRERAGRELEMRAEKSLPALRAALRSTEAPEVRRRLAVLVRKLDHDRLVAPKLITMSMKEKSVKEVLDEISRQSGYKIEFNGGGGNTQGKYSFDFDHTPFWEAADKVANASGCMVVADYDDETIRIYNQDAVNPYVAYSGPYRFLATAINSNKNVQLSGINRRGIGGNRQEYINLNFQIQSEPKNPMLGITTIEVISAVDELGGSLAPPKDPNNRSNYYNNGSFRGHNTNGNLNLNRNDKNATTIKSLKARLGINLLSGTAPEITITDPLKMKTKTFVGRTVELEFGSLVEDANNKGFYTLDAGAKKLGEQDPNRFDYNWSNNIWQKLELLDAAGNRYTCNGPNNFNNNGFAVQFTVNFSPDDRRTGQRMKLGPPVKLVMNEWLSVTHEVTFEFKDIPLP
jgi:hypothetical protein